MLIAFYVDDGLLIGKDFKLTEKFIEQLEKTFEIRWSSDPNGFLGIEISRPEQCIKLSQQTYVSDVLKRYRMNEVKIDKISMLQCDIKNTNPCETKEISFSFRGMIGSLLYLSNKMRPDIAFAINREERCKIQARAIFLS